MLRMGLLNAARAVMSALQWALLILSVAIVIAVVVVSRRERKPLPRWEAPAPGDPQKRSGDQMDIFQAPPPPVEPPRVTPASPESPAVAPEPAPAVPPLVSPLGTPLQFDEFGVGRPRKRVAPSVQAVPGNAAPVAEPPGAEAPAPAFLRAPAALRTTSEPAPAVAPKAKGPEKIIALLIVERDGAAIPGPRLHQALAAQGLVYGARQIYHRMSGAEPVFSVASLVKPGVLVPEAAAGFTTPGLSVFMVLPGPIRPLAALQDMLATAQALARALNAEVLDAHKQPLTSESMRALQAEVEEWARAARL